MKKLRLIYVLGFLLSITLSITTNAQEVPKAFYFQAFVSSPTGQALVSQEVGVQLSIIQDSPSGAAIYTETHEAFTNPIGAIDLMVGLGTTTLGTFNSINWGEGPYFIELSIDKTGGTNYQLMGVSQFLSVPYAFYARNLIGLTGAQGPAGAEGPAGAQGPAGEPGEPGQPGGGGFSNCSGCDNDGGQGPSGPAGPAGQNGLPGLDIDGISCWDLNGNGQGDTNEDTNSDGVFSVADCNLPGLQGLVGPAGNAGPAGTKGPKGPTGLTGPQGEQGDPGPEGIEGDPSDAKWAMLGGKLYRINGFVGIGTDSPNCKLDVVGDICSNGVVLTSDKRFKKNIQPLKPISQRVFSIEGVRYDFKQDEFPNKDFSDANQIGLIAQEVEAVFPEMVNTDDKGYKSVNYDQMLPVLLQTLQELVVEKEAQKKTQQNQIESLSAKVELLFQLVEKQTEIGTEEE